jgi:hypothetical protein
LIPYEPPGHNKEAFNCPLCGAYADHGWQALWNDPDDQRGGHLDVAVCRHCKKYSIWHRLRMIYPTSGAAPLPNPDLPDDIRADYEEARSISSLSPRGAAALLRLAMEKLCGHLNAKGRDLNAQIAFLVQQGLDPLIQQSLDSVRVVGNEAVHPGQIDLKDDEQTAATLFELVNLIAERMITYPKRIEEAYQRLPEDKRKAIDDRDRPKPQSGPSTS